MIYSYQDRPEAMQKWIERRAPQDGERYWTIEREDVNGERYGVQEVDSSIRDAFLLFAQTTPHDGERTLLRYSDPANHFNTVLAARGGAR